MNIIILILFLLGIPSLVHAVRGPSGLAPTTTGTQLTVNDSWEATIEGASSGTYLLRNTGGATFTPSNVLIIPTGVTVRPYNGQAITIAGGVQVAGTFEGFTVSTTGVTPGAITLRPTTLNGTVWATPVVRYNQVTAVGNANNQYAIRLSGDLESPLIESNVVNRTGTGAAGAIYYANNLGTGARLTRNLKILDNEVTFSGDGDCIATGNQGTNVSGYWAGTANRIGLNYLHDCTDENGIDIKGAGETGASMLVDRNTIVGTNIPDACLLIATGSTVATIIVEYNFISGCTKGIGLGGKYVDGQTTETNWRATIRNNIIKMASTSIMAIQDKLMATVIERNVISSGILRLDADIPGKTTTVRDNTFSGSVIDDNTASPLVTCQNNVLFTVTGAFTTTCTGGRTDTPSFVNAATNDYNSQQTTHVNAGTTNVIYNGSARDIGLLDAPILSSCEIGVFAADVIVCTWENNQNPPLSSATTAQFTARVATVARTINTTTIVGTNQTHHTLASAVTAGQAVDITCTTIGCAQDSANIGGANLALNGKAKVFSQFSVTNNVDGSPPAAAFDVTAFQFYSARTENGETIKQPGPTAAISTDVALPAGAAFLLTMQVDVDQEVPAVGAKLRYKLNGGSITDVPDTMGADKIMFIGSTLTSSDIPAEGTPIASCLSGSLTNVAGSIQKSAFAVPTFDLTTNQCIPLGYLLITDRTATVGDVFTFFLYDQGGAALNADPAEVPTMTVGKMIMRK